MLTPEYLSEITENAEDIASQLHKNIIDKIITRIMARLGRGEDYLLTATDKWQIEVLQDAGYLLEDIQREIASRTKVQQKEIKEAMEEAGVKALQYDDKIYQAAGLSPKPLRQSPGFVRLMQRGYESTAGEWRNMTRTTANAAQRLFLKEIDNAYHMVTSGAVSYTEAVRDAIRNVSEDGLKIKYPTGREMTVEAATMMTVRTGISQAAGDVTMVRMVEHGVGYVLTSSHLGARPTHEPWQGKIFSVDWRTMKAMKPELFADGEVVEVKKPDKKYPDFVKTCGYGRVDGICGANCRHSFSPYYPGISNNPFEKYDSKENKEAYDKRQKQRALERRVRDTKRKLQNMQTAIDNCKDEQLKSKLQQDYGRKAHTLKNQNSAYDQYCKENELKKKAERLAVAKWDRQQAMKAAGAARRYENAKGE